MNIEKLNPWLTLVSNIAVVIGIVFLALEIQQNSEILLIDSEAEQREKVLGRFIESEYLPEIEAKISDAIGLSNSLNRLMTDYGLTNSEARRWSRYMLDQWLSNARNWQTTGDDQTCLIGARLMSQNDNHILIDELARNLGLDYVECVKNVNLERN